MIILASWEGNTWAGQGGLSSVDRDGENKLAISKRSNRRILVTMREKSREMRKEMVHSTLTAKSATFACLLWRSLAVVVVTDNRRKNNRSRQA